MRMILHREPTDTWSIPTGLWAYRLDRERAVLGGALSNGGNLQRWIWKTTGTAPDDATSAAADALPPDATGLTVLPFVTGERSPAWYDGAAAVITGLTLDTEPAELIRAGMEATAYRLAEVYDALSELAEPDHAIVVNGGAITDWPAWLQIIADTLGHQLISLPPGDESTSRGAALMAAFAAGLLPRLEDAVDIAAGGTTYEPDVERHERYRAGRERQKQLERVLVSGGFLQ
jgi:gluconokinase